MKKLPLFLLLIPVFTYGQVFKKRMISSSATSYTTESYQDIVVDLSPMLYYPMDEISGTTTSNAMGDASYNASNVNVQDFRQFYTTTGYNYSTSRTNFYTTSFNTNFNKAEGSIALWFRMITKDDWTPVAAERLLSITNNDDNRFLVQLTSASEIQVYRIAGGTVKSVSYSLAGTKPLNWQSLVFTWSIAADQFKMYLNGVQVGATQTGLTAFVGSLDNTKVCIGANDTSNALPLTEVCISNVAIWTSALSAGDVTTYSTHPSYTNPVNLTHSITATWDIFSLFGITGSSLAVFAYDVNGDGDKEFVGSIGRRARFVAVEQDGTVLWDNTVSNTQGEPGRMPFIRSGFLYHADRNHVYCIRLSDGNLMWDQTVFGSIPTYITLNETSYGVVIGVSTKLDVLDYTTGASIGGNFPVTLPYEQWEQSLGVGDLTGDGLEEIFTNDNNFAMRCYNSDGTFRFSISSAQQYDWYEVFDIQGTSDKELVLVSDDLGVSTQAAGEGNELAIYNSSGTQIDKFIGLSTGGLEFHCYNFPNGGKVVFTYESDYNTRRITMLDNNLDPIWQKDVGYPYEGDQCLLYDVDNDGTPEILYSTEQFSSTGGFRVLDYNGERVNFYAADNPTEPDDIIDRRGAAVNNRVSRLPYYFPAGEFIQFTNRTTDNTCHEMIYLHEWN